MFWYVKNVAKLYRGYVLAYANCSQTILGVCFGYDFHMAKHTPGMVVRGGICLPATSIIKYLMYGMLFPDTFSKCSKQFRDDRKNDGN